MDVNISKIFFFEFIFLKKILTREKELKITKKKSVNGLNALKTIYF
jgi:hypothetical protein